MFSIIFEKFERVQIMPAATSGSDLLSLALCLASFRAMAVAGGKASSTPVARGEGCLSDKAHVELVRAAVLAVHSASSALAGSRMRQPARLLRAAEALARQALVFVSGGSASVSHSSVQPEKQAREPVVSPAGLGVSRSAHRRRRRRLAAAERGGLAMAELAGSGGGGLGAAVGLGSGSAAAALGRASTTAHEDTVGEVLGARWMGSTVWWP